MKVRTTPRSRAECRRLGIDLRELAVRVPDDARLHLLWDPAGWRVRLIYPDGAFMVDHADLGYAIEFVLTGSHA
jgi:hypothetical protein